MPSVTRLMNSEELRARPEFCLPHFHVHLDRPQVEGFPCILGIVVNDVLEGVALAELARRLLPRPPNWVTMSTRQCDDYIRQVNLIDLYVLPGRRQEELAAQLLKDLEECLQKSGAVSLTWGVIRNTAQGEFAQRVLARCGYEGPQLTSVQVCFTLESVRHASWFRAEDSSPKMQLVAWNKLTLEQRDQLKHSDKINPWIPARLNPFEAETKCEPLTSLAALQNGHVVGWMITHQKGDLLVYSSVYLRPELARRGYLRFLIRAQFLLAPSLGIRACSYETTLAFDKMLKMTLRWFSTLSTQLEARLTWKKRFRPLTINGASPL